MGVGDHDARLAEGGLQLGVGDGAAAVSIERTEGAAEAQPLTREPSTSAAPGSALIAGMSDQIAMNGVTWRPGISIGAAVTRCSTSSRRYVLAA